MTDILSKLDPLYLWELFPACFNLQSPRPIKVGIRGDVLRHLLPLALAEGETQGLSHQKVRVRLSGAINYAFYYYCSHANYLRTLVAGAERIDLNGQVAGTVTDKAAQLAIETLKQYAAHVAERQQSQRPPPTVIKKPKAAPVVAPALPDDAPLTAENIVAGKLELTVKFSELPKPMPIKTGMKIGVQTESALIVATLPNKMWKKLEKAQAEWPSWVAAMTGKLGIQVASPDGVIVMLESPAVQVFEKKGKPVTET